jgi:hypothetical protein
MLGTSSFFVFYALIVTIFELLNRLSLEKSVSLPALIVRHLNFLIIFTVGIVGDKLRRRLLMIWLLFIDLGSQCNLSYVHGYVFPVERAAERTRFRIARRGTHDSQVPQSPLDVGLRRRHESTMLRVCLGQLRCHGHGTLRSRSNEIWIFHESPFKYLENYC